MAVNPGESYAFSAYIKGSNADSVVLKTIWKNAAGGTIRTDTASSVTISTSFTRINMLPTGTTVMTAPATAATATVSFTFTGVAGHIYYVDSVLFETGTSANPYFDGSTGYANSEDLLWEQNAAGNQGTASTGRSLYYPNRLLTQNRFNTVLPDYLPLGSNYAVFIGTTST